MSKDRIAIIGIGCRFPGGINHPDALWKLLVEGREAVGEVPPDRWNVERYYDAEPIPASFHQAGAKAVLRPLKDLLSSGDFLGHKDKFHSKARLRI